jgi:enoyl-CoA hydratase
MAYQNIIVEEKDNGIFLLTINRPSALNALNPDVLNELSTFVNELKNNASARVLLITGAGDKAFIAGADISQFKGMTPKEALALSEQTMTTLKTLEDLPIPVIALVNGYCLGGGCEVALACDFILASKNAVFAQPEVKIGVMPGWGATQRLSRLIGRNRALELLLTGRNVNSDEAHQMGLANHVYDSDQLMEEGLNIANQIASLPPLSIKMTKKMVMHGQDMDLEQACLLESEAFALCFSSEDKEEGVSAFLEKRKPNFSKTL